MTGKATMTRHRQRPVSHSGPPPPQTRPAPAARPAGKVFNCIVDDSALVAGVKRSTRNGIRQWVKSGQIRLFVPLHALEELSRQKNGKNKHADDVRETLQWLDEATTKHPNVVGLQGADETYGRWAEVERFSVPRTLFSENDHELENEFESCGQSEDTTHHDAVEEGNRDASLSSRASNMSRSLSPSSLKSVRSSVSPVSPPTSPAKAPISPTKHMASLAALATRPQSASDSVPQTLQPLFNYILWRIHQELDPVAALESFIFLCNDPRKVTFAKGFDIKVKRLEQLREAVSREERDFRNRQALLQRESQSMNVASAEPTTSADVPEEALPKPSPPKAPAAMLNKQNSNYMDPNAFGRRPQTPSTAAIAEQPNGISRSPRSNHASLQRGSPRTGHMLPFASRGGPRGNMRGNYRGSIRGRGGNGNFGPARSDLLQSKSSAVQDEASGGQIDPDSFARPDARAGMNGSRGGRKLWVPT